MRVLLSRERKWHRCFSAPLEYNRNALGAILVCAPTPGLYDFYVGCSLKEKAFVLGPSPTFEEAWGTWPAVHGAQGAGVVILSMCVYYCGTTGRRKGKSNDNDTLLLFCIAAVLSVRVGHRKTVGALC